MTPRSGSLSDSDVALNIELSIERVPGDLLNELGSWGFVNLL